MELRTERGHVRIVGIEGGEHPAFEDPPYYDPAALKNNRVIIAAFSTGKDLPAKRTRIARIHVMRLGEKKPEYTIKLEVAASAEGERIPARAVIEQWDGISETHGRQVPEPPVLPE